MAITLTDENTCNIFNAIEKHRGGIDRIRAAFKAREDTEMSDVQAYIMWKSYSDTWAASWMEVGTDHADIINNLSPFYRAERPNPSVTRLPLRRHYTSYER